MMLSLSIAVFCRPNSLLALYSLQRHVRNRHRRDYGEHKAVVKHQYKRYE